MSALHDGDWRVIAEDSRDGPTNMALDEVAAATAADGGPRTVRVYRWEPSTLSLGYNQDPSTIDWDVCDRAGIGVTRRQTGGGAIYHDAYGDVSYSVVAPAEAVPGDLSESYELLCEPLLEALSRMGIDAGFAETERPAVHDPACYLRGLDPAHDVVGPDGGKLSGNAQYRQRDAVVQHGSLTFERSARRHCDVFAADLDPDTFRDRVTSVSAHADLNRDEVVATLTETLREWVGGTEGSWTPEELADARELAAAKYGSEDWTRRAEATN